MTFIKIRPVEVSDNIEEFYLQIDRISSFNNAKLEAHGDVVQIHTVYGTNFYVKGTADEFADDIRAAIYRMTYFPPVTA